MNCIGNYLKNTKSALLEAAAESGLAVEWRDEPDERMTFDRDKFGSLWTPDGLDCSAFWRAYERIVKAAK